ncbi:MAG TPA: hypothetical protein VF049_22185 [Nocardioidaceae bacterium]
MPGNPIPLIVATQNGPWAQLRVGTVVSFTVNTAAVSVGGSTITAAYLEGVQLAPGVLVAVANQDATWLILGRIAGVGVNLLATGNPSFEDSLPGAFPAQWLPYNIAGTAEVTTATDSNAPDGAQVARVASANGAASNSYLYSQPIPVTAGDQLTVSTFVGGEYPGGGPAAADAALVGLWFANATDIYPATSSADTVAVTATDVVQAPPYTTLSGTLTAPVTGYLRLALRTTVTGTQALRWDGVIVRRA